MKAILTKTLPVTLTAPMRIKAYDADGNNVVIGDADIGHYGFAQEEAHRIAANKLKQKMGWKGGMVAGWTKDGFAFVFKS